MRTILTSVGGRGPSTRVGVPGLLVLALAACGSSASRPSATTAAGACPTRPVPVVVSVDQWGDIVSQLAGACGDVTTIFKSTSADPHDYEATPADTQKFAGAKLVVVNGLDYDPWADKAVAAVNESPVVVNAGSIVGLRDGDNPHVWYGPDYVFQVADAVTAALKQLEPRDAAYFGRSSRLWKTSMRPYQAAIAAIKRVAAGKSYGATEGIFSYMAAAVGLRDATPAGFERATANESEPSPGDLHDFEQALTRRTMSLLIFNTQTSGAIPDQLRSQAESAQVPVVDVTESVPPSFDSFEAWQVSQLHALAGALKT